MNILYVSNTKASWALNDFNILSRHFNVTDNFVSSIKSSFKAMNPFFIIHHDVVVFWFASLSYLPILLVSWILRKKIVIIAGGYDVVKHPNINYGAFNESWPKRFLRKFIFLVSDRVISVSFSNQQEALHNVKVPNSKSEMIYHGFKKNQLPLRKFQDRKKQIITIGAVTNETYLRKGHKYFVKLAQRMPDWKFILIGKVSSDFQHLREFQECLNLSLPGFLPDTKFNEILNESKFYLQLSNHEGFGCSIVDAALMGCYPIVYDQYAMPEVVEGCGRIVKFGDLSSIESVVSELENTNINVESIRSHYYNKFPEEVREEKLVKLLTSLDKI